jgi:alcohol dehydrogenase
MSIPPKANWNYPTSIRVGPGRIAELPEACRALGMQRPLLVTDSGLAKHPMIEAALNNLREASCEAGRFSQVKSNPTGQNVSEGVAAYRAGDHDGVIAFGGGSGLDAGKTIAFMSGQDRPVWEYEDREDWWTRARPEGIAPIVAVPTTAGTGSEVGRAAVITDEASHEKKIIFHPRMLPGIAILDPELTVGLGPELTAATGIDAFSHCFEAFFARGYHPLADGIALEGMTLVQRYLPTAVTQGDDLEARQQMLVAAAMGATAFQKGLGAVHSLAHAIGALFDTHHGRTIGILLPYVLAFNGPAIGDRIAVLSRALDLPSRDAAGLLEWLVGFRNRIGIAHTLSDLGIPLDAADAVARLALVDPSTGGNPRDITGQEFSMLYRAAHTGDVDSAACR